MVKIYSFLFLLIMGTGCSGLDIDRDYDTDFDFSKLHTYRFKDNGHLSLDKNTLVGQRAVAAISTALAQQGFTQAVTEQPDFLVKIEYWQREYVEPSQVGVGVGIGSGNARSFGGVGLGMGTVPRLRERETLAISMYQMPEDREIWRGQATGDLQHSDPKKNEEKIRAAVFKILEKFKFGGKNGK